jgi:nicotinate dehydrogenase subunit B
VHTLPVSSDLGYIPVFKSSLNDGQVVELISYPGQQFAPDEATSKDIVTSVAGPGNWGGH